MTRHPRDDEPRDPHLVAALRHAPDRALRPPAPLSAAILDQARQAVRPRSSGPSARWREAWSRLWQPAPMAAFGTLALATLIGVMWSGHEPPYPAPGLRPQLAAPAETPVQVRAASSAQASAAPVEPGQRAAPPVPPHAATKPPPTQPASAATRPAAPARERQAAAPQTEARRDTDVVAAPPAAAPSPFRPPGPAPVVIDTPAARDALAKSMPDTSPARARGESAALAAAAAPALSPWTAASEAMARAARSDAASVR